MEWSATHLAPNRKPRFYTAGDQLLHGGHRLNAEELDLAYVQRGAQVHCSSRAAVSPLSGNVSCDLAKGRGGMKDRTKDQMIAHPRDAAEAETSVLPVLMTTTEVARIASSRSVDVE